MINPMELTGKHILITGGSSGVGRAAAVQASRLGARVTIIARNEERLQETISMMDNAELHKYYVMDLNEVEKIEGLIKQIVTERGAIDGFCHAAGIGSVRPIRLSNFNYMQSMFRIHIFAYSEFVRVLSKKGNLKEGASIVGISSYAADNGAVGQAAYASAKSAMNGLLSACAKELVDRKIRINNVAYAFVETAMYHDFLEYGEKIIQKMGIIDVESAANTIMFLFCDSSRYITGTVIEVYAGI